MAALGSTCSQPAAAPPAWRTPFSPGSARLPAYAPPPARLLAGGTSLGECDSCSRRAGGGQIWQLHRAHTCCKQAVAAWLSLSTARLSLCEPPPPVLVGLISLLCVVCLVSASNLPCCNLFVSLRGSRYQFSRAPCCCSAPCPTTPRWSPACSPCTHSFLPSAESSPLPPYIPVSACFPCPGQGRPILPPAHLAPHAGK